MKKKRFLGLGIGILAGAAIFALGACTGGSNEDDSRYAIYKEAIDTGAFKGTYEEWLDSIKG